MNRAHWDVKYPATQFRGRPLNIAFNAAGAQDSAAIVSSRSNFMMLLAATRGHAELFYRTLRKTVIGIDPSGRGATLQESSSPFNS
jgi:hypothetical protein